MAETGPDLPTGTVTTHVEWTDTDASGIYHNSTVARFVEAAEASLMRERGLPDYFPSAPRVRYEADFLAPLFFGQEATTTVRLVGIGTSSMRWEFEVWGSEHGSVPRTLAARGSYVTVHIGTAGQAASTGATPWPAAWVAALTGDVPGDRAP